MGVYDALVRGGDDQVTVANALSMGSLVSGLLYLRGGSQAWGLLSIALDEVDGQIARARGTAGPYGAALDWGVDLVLLGAFAERLGATAILPPAVAFSAQAAVARSEGTPSVLSLRALLMLYGMARYGRIPQGEIPEASTSRGW